MRTGRRPTILLTAASLVLLFGCALPPDGEQVRVCRQALPALNPNGRVVVTRVLRADPPAAIRIDYLVEREGGPRLERFAICRFAGRGLAGNKAELTSVVTESGPLSGPSLHLLKRFYLDTPEASAGDPGMRAEEASLAEVSPHFAYALQQALVAMPKAAIYGLLAAAYALVFGLVARINLAFGEIAAMGAAAAVTGVAAMLALDVASPLAGLALGLVAAAFAGGFYGWAGGHLTVVVVGGGAQPSLIASVGLSIALMELLRLLQGPATVWLPPVFSQPVPLIRAQDFVVVFSPVSLLTTGVGLVTASALVAAMRFSSFGRAWRANADDALAAALFGIDRRRLLLATLALSGAMAGLAGLLIVVQYGGLGFAEGFQFGLKALIAAVLGGIGSVPGALLGGVAVGAFEAAWSAALPIEARDIALYAALAAILALRPSGFAGSRDRLSRRV